MNLYLLDIQIPLLNGRTVYAPVVIEADLDLDYSALMNQETSALLPLVEFLAEHSSEFKNCHLSVNANGQNFLTVPYVADKNFDCAFSFVNTLEDEQVQDLDLVSPTWVTYSADLSIA